MNIAKMEKMLLEIHGGVLCHHCQKRIRGQVYYLELNGERTFCKECMQEYGEEAILLPIV